MSLDDMIKKPLRRLNPYRGLIVDVSTWSDAHDYHRAQHRLHTVSMHSPGVVLGLDVVAWNPPDNSVVIYSGVALDSEGHTIIVGEPQRFYLQVAEQGTAYIVIRYREVADEMADTPGEGEPQARYILEGYTLEERRELPDEAYVELARVEISGAGTTISDPQSYRHPQADQIDLRHRMISGPHALGEVGIGVVPLENADDGQTRHLAGAQGLVRAINSTTGYQAAFKGPISLNEEIRDCHMLLLAGREEFTLTEAWQEVLQTFLARGGVLVGEICGAGAKGAKAGAPFSDSYKAMAERLDRTLSPLSRGHDLFDAYHLFAEAPEGINGTPELLENDGIVFSDGDYGCLWDGGRPDAPASRASIRAAVEFGINLGIYSSQRIQQHSVLMYEH